MPASHTHLPCRVVALVSAATGFYYGAKSNENKDYRSV